MDRSLLAVSIYLDKSIHAFRLRQKAFSTAKSKGGKQEASDQTATRRATHAALFIAEGLPRWQAAILGILKQMHSVRLPIIPFSLVYTTLQHWIATVSNYCTVLDCFDNFVPVSRTRRDDFTCDLFLMQANGVLPENKEIMEKIKDNNEIKKFMKQAMPYVQLIKVC